MTSTKRVCIGRSDSSSKASKIAFGLFVATQNSDQKYDRDFLLSPEKRNQLVELWEAEKYGRDCFNDPNHVHLYGMVVSNGCRSLT
jgi:hypothetical protein